MDDIRIQRYSKTTIPRSTFDQVNSHNRTCFPRTLGVDDDFQYVYVARNRHKQLVGHVFLYNDNTIANVCVYPEWRNKGVGSALLKRLLSDVENKHVKLWVRKSNTGAIHLYSKLGFRPTSTQRDGEVLYERLSKLPPL